MLLGYVRGFYMVFGMNPDEDKTNQGNGDVMSAANEDNDEKEENKTGGKEQFCCMLILVSPISCCQVSKM